jgi:hypothetical protein
MAIEENIERPVARCPREVEAEFKSGRAHLGRLRALDVLDGHPQARLCGHSLHIQAGHGVLQEPILFEEPFY